MKVSCKNCLPKEGINVPEFSIIEKRHLHFLKQKSIIKVILYLQDIYKLKTETSKYIAVHINLLYGKCNRCNYQKLDREYINCPKCKALNFNWVI